MRLTAREYRTLKGLNGAQLQALRRAVETGELPPVKYARPRFEAGRGWVVASDDGQVRVFEDGGEAQGFYEQQGEISHEH